MLAKKELKEMELNKVAGGKTDEFEDIHPIVIDGEKFDKVRFKRDYIYEPHQNNNKWPDIIA